MAEPYREQFYAMTARLMEESRNPQYWSDSNASTRRNSTGSLAPNYPLRSDSAIELHEKGPKLPKDSHSNALDNPFDDSTAGTEKSATVDPYSPDRPKLSVRQRLKHFTWAWYTFPMSTGGLALLIAAQPKSFPGLMNIGLAVYSINLFIFLVVTTLLIARFCLYPGTFMKSLKHPREGFFFPTAFLATATIITSTERYIVPYEDSTLAGVIQGAFWGYVVLSLILALGQYSFVFAGHSFGLQKVMPTIFLPIFPTMLSGTIASVIARTQPEISVVPILITGLTCQGLGIFVSLFMYAHMIGRLLQSGLPSREHRTGLFMCVGPPAFTALAFIGMANSLPDNFNPDGDRLWSDSGMIQTLAVMGGVFLWALSFWWLGIGIIAVAQAPPKYFHLGWWATVFPNTGFTLATITIAKEFGNDAVLWFTSGMSIVMVLVYLFVFVNNARAVIVQDIMYPGLDEDFEDH